MVQVADWLTHYLTQFNGERPDMVSVIWDDRITVFCLLYIWKTLFFSGELLWWQPCSCLQNTLKDLRAEVQRFSKVNHLVWSTWSVIQVNDNHSIFAKHKSWVLLILQAVSSSIDYDYFEYARIRLGEYLKLKTEQWTFWFEKCLGEWKYIWVPQTLCEIIWIFAHYLSWFSTHHCFRQK